VLANGNLAGAPREWSQDPPGRRVIERARDDSKLFGAQVAFDVPGDPSFPEAPAFAFARDLGVSVTTHAGVWGATNDDGIRVMYENKAMQPGYVYVHAASLNDESYQMIAATGGTVSLATESEQTCGQGYPPSHALRKHGIQASLSMDTSVWQSADMFSAMRATIGADRSWEHLHAHETGDTVTHVALRVEEVVDWATRGGAKALGKYDQVGSLEKGKLADVVLIKNDDSPTMTPILNPYGHVVYQAGRGDVHTVMVGGEVLKSNGKLVSGDLPGVRKQLENTVAFLQQSLGDETWASGMNPEIPEQEILTNPYQYTK
jgi:cytosine/adenosine deaminase-related metal-dependent hydrolase